MKLAEINGHIRQLERLTKTVDHGLCDSGTGQCAVMFELRASQPALQAALSVLRKRRREMAPVMELEDAEEEP